jgi:hypothetical protein
LDPEDILVAGRIGGFTKRRREKGPVPTVLALPTTASAATATAVTASAVTAAAVVAVPVKPLSKFAKIWSKTTAETTAAVAVAGVAGGAGGAGGGGSVAEEEEERAHQEQKEYAEAHVQYTASALSYMCAVDFKRRFPDGRMWSNVSYNTTTHNIQPT